MRAVWVLLLFGSLITYHFLTPVSGEELQSIEPKPSFDQCKPYVDAALKTGSSSTGESSSSSSTTESVHSSEDGEDSGEDDGNKSDTDDASKEDDNDKDSKEGQVGDVAKEDSEEGGDKKESKEDDNNSNESEEKGEAEDGPDGVKAEDETDSKSEESDDDTKEEEVKSGEEDTKEEDSNENDGDQSNEEGESKEGTEENDSKEEVGGEEKAEDETAVDGQSQEDSGESGEKAESDGTLSDNVADNADESQSSETQEEQEAQEDKDTSEDTTTSDNTADVSGESEEQSKEEDKSEEEKKDAGEESEEKSGENEDIKEEDKSGENDKEKSDEDKSGEEEVKSEEEESQEKSGEESEEDEEDAVEPYIPRSRDHVTEILGLDDSDRTKNTFTLLNQATQITLKELKRIYENAVKPLETLYKYRDLSNRHFADPEIFSKPLVVFMGPWSGGKSTIINWLLDIQHDEHALRTGADPSPAQFNIMMYGKEAEVLDGTQLAADWTFSGLQKFGQSFLDRLRGQKLPNRLLEKVNIVEIPGILEVRKQVERSFPFNDACQWFIDRADVLFLVYDPAKLDIGPETEAILDQLKGRESQVRIVLNKADTVTPDELLRVQAMLVWNISPLMSSAEPPVMYAASLWDHPLQPDSPKALLTTHENNFLKDIRAGVEKQVETRIAAARRFAVRVRNHAKMVDCYLNTYHNHRSFFGDKKKVSNDIIDHPQNYHIYEGLSTLTNISRYDLPDPDTYKDFFKLNNLWNFPTLPSTCGYFRGCPINKLDIAIAYELPELLGKFRRQREAILTAQAQKAANADSPKK